MKKSLYISLTALLLCVSMPAYAQSVPVGNGRSANWAGYTASGDTYTGVGGTWNVPIPTASFSSDLSADATWVGIGGVVTHDLIQAGTQAEVVNGTVHYVAWYEVLPQSERMIPLAIHGGDSVTVSLTEAKKNVWHLIFRNNTTGMTYQTNISYVSTHASADWIEEMPMGASTSAGFVPLDAFGSVRITNAYAIVNGVGKTPDDAGATPVTMVSQGRALAVPSALSSDTFTVNQTNESSTNVPVLQDVIPQRTIDLSTAYTPTVTYRIYHRRLPLRIVWSS